MVHRTIADPTRRRVLFGSAMGATAILNIYSPWGKRSGAHLNPATTLTFWRLGKVETWDVVCYSLSQFAGAIAGVLIARLWFGNLLAHPNVNYVATVPGMTGAAVAFAVEVLLAFILISVVLRVANTATLARYTGPFAGALVAIFITLEAPLSGMSMNPARSLGSAMPAHVWTGFWIYFTAPPLGMLLAAELYLRRHGAKKVFCAKLHRPSLHGAHQFNPDGDFEMPNPTVFQKTLSVNDFYLGSKGLGLSDGPYLIRRQARCANTSRGSSGDRSWIYAPDDGQSLAGLLAHIGRPA